MSDRDVLADIIHPDAVINLAEQYKGRFSVVLYESKAPDSKLTIRGCPSDCLVLNLDSAFDNTRLFNGANGVSKRADFMLISEEKKKVIFIEMKRSGSPNSDIIKQLTGSLCVFEYFKSVLQNFFQSKTHFSDYSLHFISAKHTTLNKGNTKIVKNGKCNNTPKNLLELSHTQSIEFNMLG